MRAGRRFLLAGGSAGLLAVTVLAAVGLVMTFPNGGANVNGEIHCKGVDHLEVTVGTRAPTTNVATATWQAAMPCKTQQGGTQPGVVVSVSHNHPLSGLHLLPDAVAWLPGALRAAAASCGPGETVTLSHTIGGNQTAWASFTPSSADGLASAIEVAAGVA